VPMPFLPMSQGAPFNSDLWNFRELIGPVQRTNNQLSHLPQLTFIHSSNPSSLNAAPTIQCSLGWKSLDISVQAASLGFCCCFICSPQVYINFCPITWIDFLCQATLPESWVGSFHLQSSLHHGLPSHAGKYEVRCAPHLIQAAGLSF
jgi:hypothetical protein